MRIARPIKTRSARWKQFGLRGMFLAIAACAFWLGIYTKRAREQNEAVGAILEWGGEADYDFEDESVERACPRAPAWLRQCLGKDFVCNVVYVAIEPCNDVQLATVAKLASLQHLGSLNASRLTDAGVTRLAGLGALRSIYLERSRLTDESFRVFGRLHQLEHLYAPGAQISDAALFCLRDSPYLRSLLVGDDRCARGNACEVTDVGIQSLAQLLNLEELDLRGSRITSTGLAHLAHLTKLRVLNLSYSPCLGDDALKHLANLRNLEVLSLNNTGVSSAGLEHLRNLTKLRVLALSADCAVADEGVAHLSGLKNLEELKLHATGVTSSAAKHLQGLTKLRCLDLSENREIDEEVLEPLANLPSLEMLDLHNTHLRLSAASARRNRDWLTRLPRLCRVDLSGTGTDAEWLRTFLPGCILIGSRTTHITRPRLEGSTNYNDLVEDIADQRDALADSAASALGHGPTLARLLRSLNVEDEASKIPAQRGGWLPDEPRGWALREEMLQCTLARMLALCSLPRLGAVARDDCALIEDFIKKLDFVSYANKSRHAAIFREFLVVTQSNARLRRLYAAATDLQFADALRAHFECLEEIKRKWLLTDIEREEYAEAPRYLAFCLHDAAIQLNLIEQESPIDVPSNEINEIWRETQPRARERPYASCWEG